MCAGGWGAQAGSSRLQAPLGNLRIGVIGVDSAGPRPGWHSGVLLLDPGKGLPLVSLAALLELPRQGGIGPPEWKKEGWSLGASGLQKRQV